MDGTKEGWKRGEEKRWLKKTREKNRRKMHSGAAEQRDEAWEDWLLIQRNSVKASLLATATHVPSADQ